MKELKLNSPQSYKDATKEQKDEICNGCCPSGWIFDVVPDTIYGLNITEACDIHDWMYHEGTTEDDKQKADKTFLENLITLIDYEHETSKDWYRGLLRFVRRRRAYKYYEAVADLGGSSFKKE